MCRTQSTKTGAKKTDKKRGNGSKAVAKSEILLIFQSEAPIYLFGRKRAKPIAHDNRDRDQRAIELVIMTAIRRSGAHKRREHDEDLA